MTGTFTRIILLVIAVTVLGSMVMVQTNSRSSILIKEAIYVGGAALALLAGAVSMFLTGRMATNRISIPLMLSFLLLMAWIVFRHYTGIQSVNGLKYIFSTLSLGALAFMTASSLDGKSRDVLLWLTVSAAAVLSVYALLQSRGVILFSWDAGITRSARSSGTMGNANLLGSFSMAMIPVGGGFLLSRLKNARQSYVMAAVFAALCAAAMVVSRTRGSLIGILALAAAVPFVPFLRRNRRRLAALLLALLLLITGSVLVLRNRMEELLQTGTGTLQVRELIWSGTLDMWLASPLAGYGPGSFQIVFPSFRNPDYFSLGVSHNTLHAHCEYLEILVDTGLAGLLLWASVAFFMVGMVRRNREIIFHGETNGQSGRWLALGIIGGILALLAEGLVSVALRWPPSALLLGLFSGLLLTCIPSEFSVVRGFRRYLAGTGMLAVGLLLLLVALPDYIATMRSSRELFRGKDIHLTSIQPDMDRAMDAAMDWNRDRSSESMEAALRYYSRAARSADSSVTWCEASVKTDPDNLGGWYALGSAYVSSARLYQQISPPMTAIMRASGMEHEDLQRAESLMRSALAAYDSLTARAPNYAEVHNNLTLVWINLGDPDSALAHMRRAWDLHVHNRTPYTERIRIINPLTRSVDGTYIRWQNNLDLIRRLIDTETGFDLLPMEFQRILFDFGTSFYRFPQLVDSLNLSLNRKLEELDHRDALRMAELTDFQVDNLEQGLELVGHVQNGDTSLAEAILDELEPGEIEALPVHRALYGALFSRRGSIYAMELIASTTNFFLWNGVDELVDFPVSVTWMLNEMNASLLESGLDTDDERHLFLLNQINMMDIDRAIFEIMVFLGSSPILAEASQDVRDEYQAIWETIGGPFYSYMEYSGGDSPIPVMAPGSLMGSSYDNLRTLVMEDTSDSEMVLLEIKWLFIFFCNSYKGIPHYSNQQAGRLVSMLADSRAELVELTGESEAQYMLGWALDRLNRSGMLQVSGEFSGYVDALRSDLTMGRITGSDLP
ncbi:MAG: O-antigen ligase family protein [Candidatus Aegiribacteria sp.]